jgi:hypothetical protein
MVPTARAKNRRYIVVNKMAIGLDKFSIAYSSET